MAYQTVGWDAFNEASNTTLASHVPSVGTSWSLQIDNLGTVQVSAVPDTAVPDLGGLGDGCLYVLNATYPSADYLVKVRLVDSAIGSDDPYYIVGRLTDSNNMYALEVRDTTASLWKKVASVWTQLGSSVTITGWTNNTTFGLKMVGTTIAATRGERDEVILQVTDSSLSSAGKAGYGIGFMRDSGDDVNTQEADNFLVTDLVASAAVVTAENTAGLGAIGYGMPYSTQHYLYPYCDFAIPDALQARKKMMEHYFFGRRLVAEVNNGTVLVYAIKRAGRTVGLEEVNNGTGTGRVAFGWGGDDHLVTQIVGGSTLAVTLTPFDDDYAATYENFYVGT